MSQDNTMTVEVAYALPDKQALLELQVAAGVTVMEAAVQSGIAGKFEGLDLSDAKFGIFGILVPAELIADPKEVRRARAEAAKERRKQGKSD
jgi:putative ubiquitin-RnfH superfamily antitoxin RatB of RatAB toxin-antitoxin module